MTMRQITFYAGIAILVGIVGYAFMLVGSPEHNRQVAQDNNTIGMLQCMACVTQKHYCSDKILPADKAIIVKELMNNKGRWCSKYRCDNYKKKFDAETLANYEYKLTSKDSYELCASFNLDSSVQELHRGKYSKISVEFESYPAGLHCFKMEVEKPKKDKKCR